MMLANKLNELEKYYFCQRQIGMASGTGYVASNTWRGFRSRPKTAGAPSTALIAAFEPLRARLGEFVRAQSRITRKSFDAFHLGEVDFVFEFLRTFHSGVMVVPGSSGTYHGYAYGSYAKVVNLAHTHWCFRPQPDGRIEFPAEDNPHLRACIHVPLDVKVLSGLSGLIRNGLAPEIDLPQGGMGSVRDSETYIEIQEYLRGIADQVDSITFPGTTVSPLAFDGYW